MITSEGVCPFATRVHGVTTFTPGSVDRVGFCDHTAGGFYSTLTDAGFWNRQGVSVHFAISRRGEIAQIVNIFDTAYAQGRLGPVVTWPPYNTMGRQNPNGYLISTEHEDAVIVNGQTQFVPGAAWTPEQYAADLRVKQWCVEEVRRVQGRDLLRFGLDSLAGHNMFDGVNRANCPGPAWRDEYRERLYADLTGGGDVDAEREEELGHQRARGYLLDALLRDYDVVPVAEPGNGVLIVELRREGQPPITVPVPMRPEVRRGR